MNRLSKWNVGTFQAFVAGDAGIAFADKSFACRLETDVNSIPEYPGPLPRAEVTNLLRECVALTEELAARGDIA